MASPDSVKILEVYKVAPAANNHSQESAAELSLPFTFYDSTWLKFPPTQNLFFYKFTGSTSDIFHSIIFPTLKESLAHTLVHFCPLAGHLTWPPNEPRPIIVYSQNHGVPLALVESNANLDDYISNDIHEAAAARPYVPALHISETMAWTMALQVTLFPGKGFCIGITTHHAVFDGKSAYIFLRAWAYTSKQIEKGESVSLSPELIPSFDRTVVKDPGEFESMYLNHWLAVNELESQSNPRSLKVSNFFGTIPNDFVRSSFYLSPESIKKIKERVITYLQHQQKNSGLIEPAKRLHISTFVLTCAYALVCMVKSKRVSNKKVAFVFGVDCRSRLNISPLIPENYFGNAIILHDMVVEAGDFYDENGVASIAKKLGDYISGLEKGLLEGAKERLERLSYVGDETLKFGIAGATRLAFYNMEFGWGKPVKVEIPSINVNALSVMEGRDGNGVEIGLGLMKHEMEAFASLFAQGLNVMQ
ncbi:phenolic glucoside malonyltransferase 1 [Ricinus communis]|uniref:Anthocyanin 5-aromatic acyltransferase, putative n=1 Tax=Ricinus communis TaxID=3988 RepID=B9SNR0_RICCO|nr:phenolic glucoside malonyltransferase 1 [Ricinus communis]EEF34768.1 Anthocyanin 5-aromatic acyltransferase, putative [Ricinus communis]|eukprot:XP_002527629.1 phenolic glucoside malonyltransferase 1 [Ricinus communis]